MIKYKKRNIYLSASIMCANWLNLHKDLSILNELNIDYLHLDIIEEIFSDLLWNHNKPDFKNSKINLDYHLMVNEPSNVETFKFKK